MNNIITVNMKEPASGLSLITVLMAAYDLKLIPTFPRSGRQTTGLCFLLLPQRSPSPGKEGETHSPPRLQVPLLRGWRARFVSGLESHPGFSARHRHRCVWLLRSAQLRLGTQPRTTSPSLLAAGGHVLFGKKNP